MRTAILWSVLSIVLSACQPLPESLRATELPSGSVLFQDDFSDPSSGWDRLPFSPEGFRDYVSGVYRIQVNGAHQLLWSGPGLEFNDLRIEVDAIRVAGPEDGDYGIVCRAGDPSNFYFLAVSSDGYYGIAKVKNGVPELIGMEAMPPSETIRRGNDSNHLRADCIGEELSLYVNGELLAQVQDADFPAGKAGLMAGAFEVSGTEVLFDNFSILKP